ncbi:hypothetical protein [Chitinophaga japonensis]|uniref:Helix-turn-helix protein n=1 Tax=Chitinophaga japonensis TaxID=104662 RepID=A0A562T003_CHIJA|nr:hypothetical protein [Chitinophaga japonensis]TWI86340.1 hypothetical protein LX66_3594 [Chitinophaga japonensis]
MNVNIKKPYKKRTIKAPLTIEEQEKLSQVIVGWGKLAAAVDSIGKTENTIKRAAKGFDVTPDTAERIRSFLATLSQPAEK